ncbi:hypothetical protein [Xanthomonas bromi]|uniref:hypothetical protein n=1 Tax=Xanthomonas bromi TaxID=56449 RepID=UPI0015E2F26F|nr:hypothetical protein [Xanthomonas bromi]
MELSCMRYATVPVATPERRRGAAFSLNQVIACCPDAVLKVGDIHARKILPRKMTDALRIIAGKVSFA